MDIFDQLAEAIFMTSLVSGLVGVVIGFYISNFTK